MSRPMIATSEAPAPDPGNLNGNRLELAPRLPPAQFDRCVECGKPEGVEVSGMKVPYPGNNCERCGARLHDSCYFKMVPSVEWEFFKAWDPDSDVRAAPDAEAHFYALIDAKYVVEQQRGPYIFVCRWCRG